MKGLRLYIPPFAPDDSGAAAVLYKLGGFTVILDAGGCAGNIAGFDEPRTNEKSSVFSAGLRDMDAILGRDEKLVEKLASAVKQVNAKFVAIIGTPVPAVIGTDYRALKRMIESRLNVPAVTLDTDGTRLYDEGISKAYVELFKTFATNTQKKKVLGILGATHFDFPEKFDWRKFAASQPYDEIFLYGYDGSLDSFIKAGDVEKNLVVSIAGLKAAKYLRERFGTPFEVFRPLMKCELSPSNAEIAKEKGKILVMHEQFCANAVRDKIESLSRRETVTVGCWFAMDKEYARVGDVKFTEEKDFQDYVKAEDFDVIFADRIFMRAIAFYKKTFIPLHHFAVSGSEARNA
ncbi:MAG: hypothetical protein IKN12_06780 [Selenomonadaceae bacterium]|nr:hypothetical protein [Selenomonadaceae bacterium]